MKRTALVAFIYLALVIIGISLSHGVRSSHAVEKKSTADLENRLEELIKNQELIIEKLDEIKQELYIVKIRATRR